MLISFKYAHTHVVISLPDLVLLMETDDDDDDDYISPT